MISPMIKYGFHAYFKVSIKRPVLLNNLVWIFQKVSVKQPSPYQ